MPKPRCRITFPQYQFKSHFLQSNQLSLGRGLIPRESTNVLITDHAKLLIGKAPHNNTLSPNASASSCCKVLESIDQSVVVRNRSYATRRQTTKRPSDLLKASCLISFYPAPHCLYAIYKTFWRSSSLTCPAAA